MTLDDIFADFELLDDWEDRYRYVIELGRTLEPLPEKCRTPSNKVQGCVSQVWLATIIEVIGNDQSPRLKFLGDSDAHIVRGLIAILFAIYSDRRADDIIDVDAKSTFDLMGLKDHLTPQRSNGFVAMVERIRTDAHVAMETAATVH